MDSYETIFIIFLLFFIFTRQSIMPRSRKRRRLTNNHRRQPVRDVQSSNRNERSLPAVGISCLEVIQGNWSRTLSLQHHLFNRLFVIKQIQHNLQNHHPLLPTSHLQIALNSCIYSLQRLFTSSASYAQSDYQLADILPHEESVADYGPPRNRNINAISNEHLRLMT